MFVRPPAVRSTRNPRRRQMPTRVQLSDLNRPLFRQVVRTRRSDPQRESYMLEVREGPAVNGNTNAAAGKSIPQPWVTIRDYPKGSQPIGLPVSVCDTLLKHLLTCVVAEDTVHTDSSEESDLACGSPNLANDTQGSSPARASGDAKSPGEEEEAGGEDAPLAKSGTSRSRSRIFQLNRLKPIRIVCEATGCTLEVTARDPNAKRASTGAEEPAQVVQVDPSRRWIMSAPLETRQGATSNGEPNSDNTVVNSTTPGGRKNPWEARGSIELHENLMPQLSTFLADVVTRYRAVNILPEVRSLYSASGGRRFFFDLRDTRWGKRLHISQVTDLHRNVIGIPLEALVSFRARLDKIINNLGLDNQHALLSNIYGDPTDNLSPRIQRRMVPTTPRDDGSNEAADSAEERNAGRKSAPVNNTGEMNGMTNRRERRRPRLAGAAGYGSRSGGRMSDNYDNHYADSGPRPTNGMGRRTYYASSIRNRQGPRRSRNSQPSSRNRRAPHPSESDTTETRLKSPVKSGTEPSSEPVAPVQEPESNA